MVYHGHIKDGRVVLDEPANLPEGAAVSLEVVEQASQDGALVSLLDLAGAAKGLPSDADTSTTLGQRLMKLAGIAKGLPPDASVNHDHYIYGTPKRTAE